MKDDADEISVAVPTKKKHHHHGLGRTEDATKYLHTKPSVSTAVSVPVSEDEDDDDESITSEQSEDSISTKSSHVMSRRRSSSRNRGGRESTRITNRSVSAVIINKTIISHQHSTERMDVLVLMHHLRKFLTKCIKINVEC